MEANASSDVAAPRWQLGARALIYSTVILNGAAVMVVEIVGTRVLGPVFGVSLYVWAALLAVTLCSLAIGYYAGGTLADRYPFPRTLSSVTAIAAVVLATAVLLVRPVLSASLSLGPRGGPLLSALLLFSPCLILLGTTGPIAVRLATTEVRVAGHRVGYIYALSTLAGLISTLAVSFVLIPNLETDKILLWTAAILAAVSALGLSNVGRAGGAALVVVCLWVSANNDDGRQLPPGLRVIERVHSEYSLLEVIEDSNRGVRLLRADHSIIGGVLTEDHRRGVFGYVHVIETLRFARPAAREVLQIGLGTGTVSMSMARHGLISDVVEIDPEVVRLAQTHFGFSTGGAIHTEDARAFINRCDRQYDLIVHDTFTGGTAPSHLFSVEVVSRLKELLRPGGVLALNFVGFDSGPDSEATWAVYRTVREVFPHIRLFSDQPRTNEAAPLGNLIFFASLEAISFRIPSDAVFESESCRRWSTTLSAQEVAVQLRPGPTVTDAANPLARLQLPIFDRHFEAMESLLPREVWLP
ncbi:MAG: hypothetical protein RLZZ450_5890 [Pseudomonadota bacterium]|jgi:spermidine synthase